MPPLYRRVTEAAAQSGLAVSLFQPREPRVRDYVSEVPILVSAEGTYHQLAEFLERLARLPRIVSTEEWKLTALGQPRRSLRADLTLATFMYRPVGSPPAPKLDARGAPAPAPAAPR
jgi:type IV pilus assembly protein PilO